MAKNLLHFMKKESQRTFQLAIQEPEVITVRNSQFEEWEATIKQRISL